MKNLAAALMACATVFGAPDIAAFAEGKVIAVSWADFRDPRWKRDEAAIKAAVEAAGDRYVSADAGASAAKQLSDLDGLINQGASALIIQAQDASAVGPAVQRALDIGLPVIAYDRPIENPGVLLVSFDDRQVGRMQAAELLKAKPEGNYALVKGPSADSEAEALAAGQMDALKPAVDAGKVKIVGEVSADGWQPADARRALEGLSGLGKDEIDAVLASSDSLAEGVIAALEGRRRAGAVPVSGQGGDAAALNRVALGTQAVSVWKDPGALGRQAGEAAAQLAGGKLLEQVPDVTEAGSDGRKTPSLRLAPAAITRSNLNLAIQAGGASKERVCQGVQAGIVPACD